MAEQQTENFLEARKLIEEASRSELDELSLDGFQLPYLPPEVGKLYKLKALSLMFNKFTKLPKSFQNLAHLDWLQLSNNNFTNIPKSLQKLTNIKYLYLDKNKLSQLPNNLQNFSKLEVLDLSDNKLTHIPGSIAGLIELKYLDLENNHLTSLPDGLQNLTNLKELDLRGNPELGIPDEILENIEDPAAILKYFYETVAAPPATTRALNEAKMILVGQGSVGKTSLINRLVEDTFDPQEDKTPGVEITDWQIMEEDTEIDVHIWDFGGQEIMHATHQFFLTKRTLYLLILDSRQSEDENRLDYWLRVIQTFGENAPVIVVGNKIDQQPLDLDQQGLKAKYPNIRAILPTSASTGDGLEELRTVIEAEINALPNLKDQLPLSWFQIKEALEDVTSDYITYREYQALCKKHKVADDVSQRTLVGWLHDLGIVFNFREEGIVSLEQTHVLNPNWVTGGVYKILNDEELMEKKTGVFGWQDMKRILTPPNYPQDFDRAFIIDLMGKFERCYSWGSGQHQRFLVPDLLPKQEVGTGEWKDALRFEFHYDVYYPSLLSRLMVRRNKDIVRGKLWRTGVLFKLGSNEVLVRGDRGDRAIRILVRGQRPTRAEALAVFRSELEDIHSALPNLAVRHFVPIPEQGGLLVDYDYLIKNLVNNIDTVIPPGAEDPVNVRQLLGQYLTEHDQKKGEMRDSGVRALAEEVRQLRAMIEKQAPQPPAKKEPQKAKIFLSYAHKDEIDVDRLYNYLKGKGYKPWMDKHSIVAGEDWARAIKKGVKESDLFIACLSPNSVTRRGWIQKEVLEALEKRTGDLPEDIYIIPLKLEECEIPERLEKLQALDWFAPNGPALLLNAIKTALARREG